MTGNPFAIGKGYQPYTFKGKGNNSKLRIPEPVKKECWRKRIPLDEGYPSCPLCRDKKRRMHWTKQNTIHYGHIVPEKKGGSTTPDNLVPICPSCNSEMSAEDMRDFVKRKFPKNFIRFMALLRVNEANTEQLFAEIREKLWRNKYCKHENLNSIRRDTYTCVCGDIIARVDVDLKTYNSNYITEEGDEIDLKNEEDRHQIVLTHYPCVANLSF